MRDVNGAPDRCRPGLPNAGLFAAGLLRECGVEPEPLVSERERRLRETLGDPATARLERLSFEAMKPRD